MKKNLNTRLEGEDFSIALKTAIKDHCQTALDLLVDKSQSEPHYVVHEVRKIFKKVRALLRLVRSNIAFYKQENRFFRDEARHISEVRDLEAALETLNVIYNYHDGQLYKNVFQGFEHCLMDLKQSSEEEKLPVVLKEIGHNLSQKCSKIDSWPVQVSGFDDIKPDILRTYSRGRKVMLKLQDKPSNEDFHYWRKRIKYLRYQLDFLTPMWPGFLDTWEDELHKLSDFVGMDRDMYNMDLLIKTHSDQFRNEENKYLLQALVKEHRSQFQQQALLLGNKLYYFKKKQFIGILEASWNVYQEQQSMPVSVTDLRDN